MLNAFVEMMNKTHAHSHESLMFLIWFENSRTIPDHEIVFFFPVNCSLTLLKNRYNSQIHDSETNNTKNLTMPNLSTYDR